MNSQLLLAEKLVSYSDHQKVFVNSGAEAVETALKLARKYGKFRRRKENRILYMKTLSWKDIVAL